MAAPAEAETLDERVARRDLLHLLSRLFEREVDAELYRRLIAPEMSDVLASTGLQWIDPDVRALSEPEALEVLATEYCRLFVGPIPACPPYASSFRGEALLGGRHERHVRDVLQRLGLEIAADTRVAALDHLSVSLSLFAGALDAADESIASEIQRVLLLPWAPEYLRVLESWAERAPYTTLARLTAAMLSAR
jgi:TorA maturation chaperone TorD